MPGFDGTGPRGMGPRTGGGFGFCAPGAGPAPAGYTPGAVYGLGRGGIPWGGGRGRAFVGGRGRGWRAGLPYAAPAYAPVVPYPPASSFDEKAFLENQVQYLEQQLTTIKDRLMQLVNREMQD